MKPSVASRIFVILVWAMVCLLAVHAELQAEGTFDTGEDVQVYVDGKLLESTMPPTNLLVSAGSLLVIDVTNGHDAITYTQGPDPTQGKVAFGNDTVLFTAFNSIVINAQGGNDDIVINNTATPTGLTDITVNCDNGDDVVYVAAESPVDITINGDEGDDTFKINPSSTAVITVHGGNHVIGDDVHVNVQGSAARNRRHDSEIHLRDFMNIPYTGIEKVKFHTK